MRFLILTCMALLFHTEVGAQYDAQNFGNSRPHQQTAYQSESTHRPPSLQAVLDLQESIAKGLSALDIILKAMEREDPALQKAMTNIDQDKLPADKRAQLNLYLGIIAHPKTKALLREINNPGFRDNMKKIATTKNKHHLLFLQLACILFFIFYRSMRTAKLKDNQTFSRMWLGLWTSAATFVCVAYFAPLIFFGSPYMAFVRSAMRVLQA